MDSLPPEVLLLICNYLPWKDKLATRRLSRKFGRLSREKIQAAVFTMRQDKNTLSFTLKLQRTDRELRTIEIVKSTQKIDFFFSHSTENEISDEFTDQIMHCITKIHCTRLYYQIFINIYLELFISEFLLEKSRLAYLNDNFLAKFRKTVKKLLPDLNWQRERRQLELYTRNIKITPEEKKLMNFCKYPHLFKFCPPNNFKLQDDFWKLLTVYSADQLFLKYGGEVGRCEVGDPVDIDLGIDNSFIASVISERKTSFLSNIISTVTVDFLINHIESCLAGGYGLFNLTLRRSFNEIETKIIVSFLLGKGFIFHREELNFILQTVQESKEGYHPDQLIVFLSIDFFRMVNDSAYHRGKVSIRKPSHPFNN